MVDGKSLYDKARRFVAFDVETTGLNAWRGDKIIEIAAVAIDNGLIGEEFHSLIGIERSIPKTATKLHGITSEMLSDQPKAEEVLRDFRQFIGRSVLVAHNADFDMSFLRWECSRTGLSLSNRCICTLKLSKKLYPGLPNYKLGTVAKHILGIEIDENKRHRALDDARMAAKIWIATRKI
jgi:DNA polymerase III epsilon subunit family exonuclease